MINFPRSRTPEMNPGFPLVPDWCHHHAGKMQLEKLDLEHRNLIVAGSAARLLITEDVPDRGWYLDWDIQFSADSYVNGRLFFTDGELKAAFGLSAQSGEFGQHLLDKYGGDSAQQGKYIRWGDFLNIPGPGTAHDGDPNVSIEINSETRQAVKQLLSYKLR